MSDKRPLLTSQDFGKDEDSVQVISVELSGGKLKFWLVNWTIN